MYHIILVVIMEIQRVWAQVILTKNRSFITSHVLVLPLMGIYYVFGLFVTVSTFIM